MGLVKFSYVPIPRTIIHTTKDVHPALHTFVWRSYTEAEVNFKTMVRITF